MTERTSKPDSQWHLDKRVPVAFIFAIFLQFGGFIWFAAQIDGRLDTAERDILRLDAQASAQAMASQAQAVQLGRIEENIVGMRGDISRLIRTLETMPR